MVSIVVLTTLGTIETEAKASEAIGISTEMLLKTGSLPDSVLLQPNDTLWTTDGATINKSGFDFF